MKPASTRKKSKGAAALEFALVLPSFLLITLGSLVISQSMVVRHRLTSAVSEAARACSVVTGPNGTAENCASLMVQNRLADLRVGARPMCAAITINPTTNMVSGVNTLRVQATCDYTGGPLAGFVNQEQARGGQPALMFPLQAQSTMPLYR